jgi:hypothetical protein
VTLPGADRAVVEAVKVRGYLLSLQHPIGRAKARFFQALGFTEADWPKLQEALRNLARNGEAEPAEANAFGQKYVVRGILEGPRRGTAIVTVWIVLQGEAIPRFVTAYPGASS